MMYNTVMEVGMSILILGQGRSSRSGRSGSFRTNVQAHVQIFPELYLTEALGEQSKSETTMQYFPSCKFFIY